jgi:type III protein arginine methyltransferase
MSDEIALALANSKYSDLVHVTLPPSADESSKEKNETGDKSDSAITASAPHEILLTAKLDHENGGYQWQNVSSTEDPIMKHLRTKIWVFPMLNDETRTTLYDRAIERAAKDAVERWQSLDDYFKSESPTIHGIDIGSGTGLLALMSSKYLQQSVLNASRAENEASTRRDVVGHVKITSLEMSRPMAILAEVVVTANRFHPDATLTSTSKQNGSSTCTTSIDIIEGHSCELPPIREPQPMFCTSELLESGLLGEGWLVSMRDAWERHLHPHAVVVPQRARVYAQVVEGLSDYWGPQKTLNGFPNGKRMCLFTTSDWEGTLSDGSYDDQGNNNGVQLEVHMEELLNDPNYPIKVLSEPMEVLDFDVSAKDRLPGPRGRSRSIEFTPTVSGNAEGVIFWWELDLYDNLTYSTKHGQQSWQDHWHQCLYVFPQAKKDCFFLQRGVPAHLVASHTDTRLHFKIQLHNPDQYPNDAKRSRPDMVQCDPIMSPRRCWILNNIDRSNNLLKAVEEVLAKTGGVCKSSVLDISDFPLCGMMAAMLGACHVTSLESSSTNLPYAAAKVAQVANGLFPGNGHPDSFLIVRCHPEQLTTSILAGNIRPNVVVGEPCYEFLEGHGVQEAVNFFNILRMLKEKKVICSNSLVVPHRAIILAQGIECADIAKAYCKCENDCCGGFDHKAINDYWSFDEHPISLPLYEYNFRPVTEIVAIASFEYENDVIRFHLSPSETVTVQRWPSLFAKQKECMILDKLTVEANFLDGVSICHAITFWIDYQARISDSDWTPKSSGTDRKYRLKEQVLLLPSPLSSEKKEPVSIPTKWLFMI